MVREILTEYTVQKNAIVSSLSIKLSKRLFDQNLHDIFNRGSQSADVNEKVLAHNNGLKIIAILRDGNDF